jgi:hypothetical protein
MAKVLLNRNLLIFIALNLFTFRAVAQYDERENLFIGGLVGGGNFAQVDGDNFAGYHKAGWNAGAILYTGIGEKLALSFELLYAQKGSRAGRNQVPKLANDRNTIITDYSIKNTYAEFPLLLNYFEKGKSNFGGGFSYAQLVRSRESYRDGSGQLYVQEAKLYPFRKYDVNFVLNGNAHIWKGFYMNLRFQYSLVSIRKATNYLTGREQQFNNVWCARLMYLF